MNDGQELKELKDEVLNFIMENVAKDYLQRNIEYSAEDMLKDRTYFQSQIADFTKAETEMFFLLARMVPVEEVE